MNNTLWHKGIGADVSPGMTIDQQLEKAGLNWQVGTSEIQYGDRFEYQAKAKKTLYRLDNGQLLDVVGKDWKPYQNSELLQVFHEFCESANLELNHLGSLDKGKTIFASADLPIEIDVRKVGDIVRGRLLLFNHHKLGYGLNIKVQFERLVCTNGLTTPVRIGNRIVNHVSAFNPDKVRQILESTFDAAKNFKEDAELLANTPISYHQALLILIAHFGDMKAPLEKQPTIVNECLHLFCGIAKGSELLSAYNTSWGLLNAVTEYFNHHSQVRGGSSTHLNSLLLGNRANRQQSFYQSLVGVHSRESLT